MRLNSKAIDQFIWQEKFHDNIASKLRLLVRLTLKIEKREKKQRTFKNTEQQVRKELGKGSHEVAMVKTLKLCTRQQEKFLEGGLHCQRLQDMKM